MRTVTVVVYRSVLALVAATGVVLTGLASSFAESLVYFTVQSNIAVAVVFGWLAWRRVGWRANPEGVGKASLPGGLKGAVTIYACITGLVFHLVLENAAGAGFQGPEALSPAMRVANQLLHTVTPLAALADWLLFDGHRRYRWRHALLWLAYPVAYLIFAMVRGVLVSGPHRYPYPFLDVAELGYAGLAGNVALYGAAFYLLGLLLVGVDRWLPAGGRTLGGSARHEVLRTMPGDPSTPR